MATKGLSSNNRVTQSKATPLWLDCDTGHDDAFAVLLAAESPAVDLLGISTVYGNASLSNTTYNTRAILTAIGKAQSIPVYSGADKPFCRVPASAPDIHGESGLDGTTCLPKPTVPAKDDSAMMAMYSALKSQPPKTAWLVATGALTNIALLFAVFPDLVEHIAGLSIMGGAVGGEFTNAPMGTVRGQGERFGNWTPWAEFNIYCDPESAQAVFSNAVLATKTTLIPLDLTHQMLATPAVCEMLLHSGRSIDGEPSATRVLFHEILVFFAKTYADVFGLVNGPPLHDPLAVAACFVPEIFNDCHFERFAVDVVIDGAHGTSKIARGSSQCGRTVVAKLPAGDVGIRIPRSLDTTVLWRMLDQCLSAVEGRC